MKSIVNKLRKKSIGWWASVATIAALIVALGAWLWPKQSFPPETALTPQPTTIAQSLGITEEIPPRKPGTIRVLVATFDEADQSSYRVTDLILTKLRSALSVYGDTEVLATDRVITEQDGSDVAIKIGEIYDASIVIWGWYGLTENAVPLGIHFDSVPTSETFREARPGTCPAVSASQIRKANPTELSDLTLQTNLSNEFSYVAILALGLARFEEGDYEGALSMFNDAIMHLDENTILSAKTTGQGILVDTDLLYFSRAGAYFGLGDYIGALDDLNKISESMSNDPSYHFNVGQVYLEKQDFALASQHFTLSIEKQPSNELSALSYYLRGIAYNRLSIPYKANKDFEHAFKLDDVGVHNFVIDTIPLENGISYATALINQNQNNFAAYYFRGFAHKSFKNPKDALRDYDKALELNSDLLIARQARVELRRYNKNLYGGDLIIQDLDILFSSEEYRTPCNLVDMGYAYFSLGQRNKAKQYFDDVINMMTTRIESDPTDVYAYIYRGMALYNEGENLHEEAKYAMALSDYRTAKRLASPDLAKHDIDFRIRAVIEHYVGIAILGSVILIAIAWVMLVFPIVRTRLRHHRGHDK